MKQDRGGSRGERSVVPGQVVDKGQDEPRSRRMVSIELTGILGLRIEVVLSAGGLESQVKMGTSERGMKSVVVLVL